MINLKDHSQAFQQGYHDYNHDVIKSACPYAIDVDKSDWYCGWLTAKNDHLTINMTNEQKRKKNHINFKKHMRIVTKRMANEILHAENASILEQIKKELQ